MLVTSLQIAALKTQQLRNAEQKSKCGNFAAAPCTDQPRYSEFQNSFREHFTTFWFSINEKVN